MTMTMDEVAETIHAIHIMARRIGQEFRVDERKLEAMGFTSGDIDDIFTRVQIKHEYVAPVTTSE